MDTIIKLETAILAKEKGFREKCSHYFILDYNNFKSNGVPKKHYTESENFLQLVVISEKQPHLASAPSKCALQKWLREVHDIEIFSKSEYRNGTKVGFYYGITSTYSTYSKPIYNSYEEALEQGLIEGLKLINKV